MDGLYSRLKKLFSGRISLKFTNGQSSFHAGLCCLKWLTGTWTTAASEKTQDTIWNANCVYFTFPLLLLCWCLTFSSWEITVFFPRHRHPFNRPSHTELIYNGNKLISNNAVSDLHISHKNALIQLNIDQKEHLNFSLRGTSRGYRG